jgi:hypothetical protein
VKLNYNMCMPPAPRNIQRRVLLVFSKYRSGKDLEGSGCALQPRRSVPGRDLYSGGRWFEPEALALNVTVRSLRLIKHHVMKTYGGVEV